MVVPLTSLLHPAREAAVGPRLLISRETPAYLAASHGIYPPPADALGCRYSSAQHTLTYTYFLIYIDLYRLHTILIDMNYLSKILQPILEKYLGYSRL